jgi:hypothetical protein
MNYRYLAVIAGCVLAAGCAGQFPTQTVSLHDQILTTCRQIQVMNLAQLDHDVDNANSPNGEPSDASHVLTSADVTALAKDGALLTRDGNLIGLANGFHQDFKTRVSDLGSQFTAISLNPDRLDDSAQATAADSDIAWLTDACGAVRT